MLKPVECEVSPLFGLQMYLHLINAFANTFLNRIKFTNGVRHHFVFMKQMKPFRAVKYIHLCDGAHHHCHEAVVVVHRPKCLDPAL